ncbi:MAG: hypothetical protein AAFN77_09820 [Planctomycetota bacterium]
MVDNDPNHDAAGDSRLKSFLRQAAGVIASEKGLTPACRLKLQAIAEQIKLPKSTFESALQQLQSDDLPVDPLTRYEQSFVDFLLSEFAKLEGELISPRMEQLAIQIAKDKYQIESSRAERLLIDTCDAKGISRISFDDARDYATQSIIARLGDRVVVDDETRAQLNDMGKEWGLDDVAVDQVIIRQVEKSRARQLGASTSRIVPLLILLLGLAIMGGIGFFFAPSLISNRDRLPPPKPNRNEVEPDRSDVPTVDDLGNRMRAYARRFPSSKFSQWIKELENGEDPPPVGPAIFALCGLGDNQRQQRESGSALLVEWFLNEVDPVLVETTASEIAQLIAAPPDFQLAPRFYEKASSAEHTVRRFRSAFAAGEIALLIQSQASTRQASESSADAVDGWLSLQTKLPAWFRQALSRGVSQKELARVVNLQLANDSWQRLNQLVYEQPLLASVLIDSVIALTQPHLPEPQLTQHTSVTLDLLLETQPDVADQIQSLCKKSIQSASPSELQRWAQFISEHPELGCQNDLARTLVEAAELRRGSNQTHVEAVSAFRQANLRSRFKNLLQRADLVNKIIEQRLEPIDDISDRRLPIEIALQIHAVNLELELLSISQNDDVLMASSYASLDAAIENVPDNLGRFAVGGTVNEEPEANDRATASDLRHKDFTLDRINKEGEGNSIQIKILALKQLARMAKRFPDLSCDECQKLAAFFLSDLPLKQRLELQQILGSFSHWHNLSLALADQLEREQQTDESMDRALTIARLLLRKEFEVRNQDDWQNELIEGIIAVVRDDLSRELIQNPNHPKANWNRLRSFCQIAYRDRFRFATSVSKNQSTSAFEIGDGDLSGRYLQIMETLIDADARMEMQHVRDRISVNQIDFLSLSNQRMIQHLIADDVFEENQTELRAQFRRRLKAVKTVGHQLLITEQMLLLLLHDRRIKVVEALVVET